MTILQRSYVSGCLFTPVFPVSCSSLRRTTKTSTNPSFLLSAAAATTKNPPQSLLYRRKRREPADSRFLLPTGCSWPKIKGHILAFVLSGFDLVSRFSMFPSLLLGMKLLNTHRRRPPPLPAAIVGVAVGGRV